jgi:hypothetical protein
MLASFFVGLLLQTQGSSALDISELGHVEAAMTSSGKMAHKPRGMMRRDVEETDSLAQAGDEPSKTAAAHYYVAPHWAPHAEMHTLPTGCTSNVDMDQGISDYGRLSHSCTACANTCTEGNKQRHNNVTMLIEPSLDTCNAFNLTYYINWTNVDGLACSSCGEKGIRHAFEMSIATNAGDSACTGTSCPVYTFEAWMGPEIMGKDQADNSDFNGKHVFEIEDTVHPSSSTNCNAVNPEGRWIAMEGAHKDGDNFNCQRVCRQYNSLGELNCHCDRTTHLRCEADMAMGSGQVMRYEIRRTHTNQTVSYNNATRTGVEWEVLAKDIKNNIPEVTVGRVVLEGEGSEYGIKGLKQSHQHMGCTPCDLFYESATVTGPFITEPAGVHAVRSADTEPPVITSTSCELFRTSSYNEPGTTNSYGTTLHFETGPGLWPSSQTATTLFTCTSASSNTCPNSR